MVPDFGLSAVYQFHFDRAVNESVADHLIWPLATSACSFVRISGHLALLTAGTLLGGQGISLNHARRTVSDPKQISTELSLEIR